MGCGVFPIAFGPLCSLLVPCGCGEGVGRSREGVRRREGWWEEEVDWEEGGGREGVRSRVGGREKGLSGRQAGRQACLLAGRGRVERK